MRRDKADEILRKVVSAPHEDEVIEFKDRRTLNKDEMGVYFSALSNEAELRDHHSACTLPCSSSSPRYGLLQAEVSEPYPTSLHWTGWDWTA